MSGHEEKREEKRRDIPGKLMGLGVKRREERGWMDERERRDSYPRRWERWMMGGEWVGGVVGPGIGARVKVESGQDPGLGRGGDENSPVYQVDLGNGAVARGAILRGG